MQSQYERWYITSRVGFGTKPCDLHVNSVQQNVQQQGRPTAGMYDHRQRFLAAEVVRSSCAPVVRIEVVVRPGTTAPLASDRVTK